MAILDQDTLRASRNKLEKTMGSVPYTKAQINAAAQAIEDLFETLRPQFNSAINTATSPLVLTPGVKVALVKHVLIEKLTRNI